MVEPRPINSIVNTINPRPQYGNKIVNSIVNYTKLDTLFNRFLEFRDCGSEFGYGFGVYNLRTRI